MSFLPRPYQVDIGNKVKNYTGSKKILIQLLTGMGKTKLAFLIMDELLKEKRFLFLVPRINLSLQTFAERGGLGLIQGSNSKNLSARVIIGTVQTVLNRVEKKRIDLSRFDYIIIDEVHALKYRGVQKYEEMSQPEKLETHVSEHTQVIGLSATPFKGDGSPLINWSSEECDIFGKEYDFDYAIKNKYLTPVLIREVTDIDDSKLKRSEKGGEFTEASVKEMLTDNPMLDIVSSCIPHIANKTCVFASNIEHCDAITKDFKARGYACEAMHSKSKEKASKLLERFNNGDIQILVTVDMLSFGQDVFKLETLILAGAIGSYSAYIQKIGRGLRPAEGKTFCHILDCMGNIQRLGHPFNKVEAPATREARKETITCKECESTTALITVEIEVIKEDQVKRVFKKCGTCDEEYVDLLPLPTMTCEECGVTSLLGEVYYQKSKVLSDCPCCKKEIFIEEIVPKEMVISFRDRDEAISTIVTAVNARFQTDVTFRDNFLSTFAIFSLHCKITDLSHIVNYVLNLKDNYSAASLQKVLNRLVAVNIEFPNSDRDRFIRAFRVLQGTVNYEFIDFLFNNSNEEQTKEAFNFFEKLRQAKKRRAKADKPELLTFKELRSIARRNYPWLKEK